LISRSYFSSGQQAGATGYHLMYAIYSTLRRMLAMATTFHHVEAQALNLVEAERVQLIQILLASLSEEQRRGLDLDH